MSYLTHVTLNTSHVRRSPRSEVGGDVVRELTPTLAAALRGERSSLWIPGYQIEGARYGRCCLVTLYGVVGESRGAEQVPVLTTGVAGHSRCGARLWRELHELAAQVGVEPRTDPNDAPGAPWVADLLLPGFALDPSIGEWTGDYSRCVAWTFLEMRETHAD